METIKIAHFDTVEEDYVDYDTMEYSKYLTTASLQIMMDTSDYGLFLTMIAKFDSYDCSCLNMFVNTPVFQDAMLCGKKILVDPIVANKRLPVAHSELAISKYSTHVKNFMSILNSEMPSPNNATCLPIHLSSKELIVMQNTSLIRSSTLISMYSVLLSNYRLINNINNSDLTMAKTIVFGKVDELLTARADVFDLGVDFYYFHDRFDWIVDGSKLLITLKMVSPIYGELPNVLDDLRNYVSDVLSSEHNSSIFFDLVDPSKVDLLFNIFGFDHVLKRIFCYWNWREVFKMIKVKIYGYQVECPYPVNLFEFPDEPLNDFLQASIVNSPVVPRFEIQNPFNPPLYDRLIQTYDGDPTRIKALQFSKAQLHLRVLRCLNSTQDLQSKNRSKFFLNDTDYFASIFDDPDLIGLNVTTFSADKSSLETGWVTPLLYALNNKYKDNDLKFYNYLDNGIKDFYVNHDLIPVDNSTKILSDGMPPMICDLAIFDFLGPGIVTHNDSSWFCMSQYDETRCSIQTRVQAFDNDLYNRLAAMMKAFKARERREYYYAMRLPYVSWTTTIIINLLLKRLQPAAFNIYPSNSPHEEFFFLIVRLAPHFTLNIKPETRFQEVLDAAFLRFEISVLRREWYFNNSCHLNLSSSKDKVACLKVPKFDFRKEFNSLPFLSMPLKITFKKEAIRSRFAEKQKKLKKKQDLMDMYVQFMQNELGVEED